MNLSIPVVNEVAGGHVGHVHVVILMDVSEAMGSSGDGLRLRGQLELEAGEVILENLSQPRQKPRGSLQHVKGIDGVEDIFLWFCCGNTESTIVVMMDEQTQNMNILLPKHLLIIHQLHILIENNRSLFWQLFGCLQ